MVSNVTRKFPASATEKVPQHWLQAGKDQTRHLIAFADTLALEYLLACAWMQGVRDAAIQSGAVKEGEKKPSTT